MKSAEKGNKHPLLCKVTGCAASTSSDMKSIRGIYEICMTDNDLPSYFEPSGMFSVTGFTRPANLGGNLC